MHLAEEQVQRLLHGELAGAAVQQIEAHIATCSMCRDRMHDAEREDQWVIARLAALDQPAPAVHAADIIRAARSPRSQGWGRWAAGIVLAAAIAGGAYAAPGSPLPAILARLRPSESSRPRLVASPERVAARAGIAMAPGERLRLSLPKAARSSAAISLSDGKEVVVQAEGGQTSFRSAPDHLIIDHQGDPAQFEISIPRAAPLVEVEVDGRRIFLKERSSITASVAADSLGRYVIPLVLSP